MNRQLDRRVVDLAQILPLRLLKGGEMFWRLKKRPRSEDTEPKQHVPKRYAPREIPEPVGRYMVVNMKLDPDWVWTLKSVLRDSEDRKNVYRIRVFDKADAVARGITVNDYGSLDSYADLVVIEGVYDRSAARFSPVTADIAPNDESIDTTHCRV